MGRAHVRAGRARSTRRRRLMAGGAAVAASAVVAPSAPAHAGTVAPSVQAVCNIIEGRPAVSGRLTDFPPNDHDLLSLFVMKGPRNGRTETTTITISTPTNAQGVATTPGGESSGIAFSDAPIGVAWVAFHDRNSNSRWDEGVDQTLYRGDGTVTACPQRVTLSAK